MNPPDDARDPRLEAILKPLDQVPPSEPQTAARGRAAFLAEAQLLKPAVSIRASSRHTGQIRFFSRKEISPMTVLTTIVLVLALALGGTGGTVYAAQGALPTDTLYGVKLWSEDVRLGLTAAPQDQANLLLEFAQRRVQEITALSAAGDSPLEPVANRLRAEVDAALQIAAGADDATRAQVLTQIQAQTQRGLQGLAQAQVNASGQAVPVLDQVRTLLQERDQLCQTGLADPQAFRSQLGDLTRDQDRLREQTGTPQASGTQDQDQLREQTGTPQKGPDFSRTPEPTGTAQRGPDFSRTPEPTGTAWRGPDPSRTPEPIGTAQRGPDPSRTPEPIGTALGPALTNTPAAPGPQPTQAGPGPQPTDAGPQLTPAEPGPQPTDPGPQPTQAGPGPQPTDAGPQPTQAGPGSQPTDAGPQPTQAGPGPQPTAKPGGRP